MFRNLFGWRKASKCKRLLKAVKCRIKLLKSRKCCIVNQLRKDVTELLKYGLDQIALQRVEQLIKDETTVEIYDLLDQFCERIIICIPYIRKHKDCPKEINEAASTLIFSSARIGELPELLSIRKLFEERYGQRYVTVALELLPENIVNRQMIEKVYTKTVPDDDKYKVLDEIASSCVQSGQYLLEYRPPELEEEDEVQISNGDKINEQRLCLVEETDGQIMSGSSALRQRRDFLNGIDDSYPGEAEKPLEDCDETNGYSVAVKSTSEASAPLPEETVYLDDIEEHKLSVCKDEHVQDLSLFVLKSFGMPSHQKRNRGIDIYANEQIIFPKESIVTSSRKKTKRRKKRSRRRSISQGSRIVTDTESATYYGDSEETFPGSSNRKSHFRRSKTILMQRSLKSYVTNSGEDITEKCSILNRPSYDNYQDENDKQKTAMDFIICSRTLPDRAMSLPAESPKEEDPSDNITRSSSFPLEQSRSRYSSCHHVHPKLPDYDDLAAKFLALKRSNLQGNSR